MKVVHFESGLGNQMLNYAEYLAIKYSNPNDKIYMENIIFEYPEVNNVICQWNGYELDRIFGLHVPNIKTLFSETEWVEILSEIRNKEFWYRNWNYPDAIVPVLNKHGICLNNKCEPRVLRERTKLQELRFRIMNANPVSGYAKLMLKRLFDEKYKNEKRNPGKLYMSTSEDIYCGQTGLFMFCGNKIELIEDKLRNDFKFLSHDDERNISLEIDIKSCNSVSIHARRGDALSSSGYYYKSGYFRRAIAYIKRNVDNPVFYFFSDPGSIDWCKTNLGIFGLNKKDTICFVDWNSGTESYRDMQLMSVCKHNVISYSSFGWWASFLNSNKDKITCSPYYCMNTTHHF